MKLTRQLLLTSFIAVLALSGCSKKTSTRTSTDGSDATSAQTGTGTTDAGKKGAKIDPKATALFQKALNAVAIGNNDLAIGLFTDMANDYPSLSGSHTNLGLIYFKDDDMDKAEASFGQAISINEANPVAHTHLGIIYRKKGRFTDAEQAYLKAIEFVPEYGLAHLNIGILYELYLRKLADALRHYETYQSLQASEDETVKKWIAGLKRQLKVPK